MKTYVITLTVGCSILLAIMAFTSENPKSDTIMIRATQTAVEKYSLIRIYKGDALVEKISLDKWSLEEEKNFDIIISTVRNYEKQGYQLTHSSELTFGQSNFVNTFVLNKK